VIHFNPITLVGETVARQLQAIFTLAIGLAVSLSASWKISLVLIATFPVTIIASVLHTQAFVQT
jgi:ABC-type multidrug transport system fused ATPase/permease subunit